MSILKKCRKSFAARDIVSEICFKNRLLPIICIGESKRNVGLAVADDWLLLMRDVDLRQ